MDELLPVYSTSDPNEAEIIRNALQGEGIRCEITGENQAGLTGLSTMNIELMVRAEDFDRAKKYLQEHHH